MLHVRDESPSEAGAAVRGAANLDHANHAWADHALRIDFLDAGAPTAGRVAVELDLESGRMLLRRLEEVIDAADNSGVA